MPLSYTIKALTAAHHLVSDTDDHALAINAAGHVVGGYRSGDQTRAWIYDGTVIRNVDLTLTGHSEAYAINDAGQIAGAYTPEGAAHPTAFVHDGTRTHLFGQPESTALAINNRGQIVGYAYTYPFKNVEKHVTSAVLWQNQRLCELNELIDAPGWQFSKAVGINEQGQIVGWGILDGTLRVFLLTPC